MFTASVGNLTEVILKSGDFLNPELARCDQLWLVKGVLSRAWRGIWTFLYLSGTGLIRNQAGTRFAVGASTSE
jgi:hypothetical protein